VHLINKKSAYFALAVGIVASILLSWYAHGQSREKELIRFDTVSKQVTLLVQNRMDAYKQILLSGVGLFNANESVTREEWRTFVETLELNKTYPGIQGVGYSAVVRADEKDLFVKSMKTQGFSGFDITPSGKRDIYTSIIYLEPFDARNKRAFGYDMFSENIRKKAMITAMETGKASISGRVKLVQENGIDEQAGFLMYIPVYKKGAKLDTKAERLQAIQGFVYAPFRVKDLMMGVAGARASSVDFEIYDGSSNNESSLLFDSFPGHKHRAGVATKVIKICDHDWLLVFSPLENFYDEADDAGAWIILFSGTLLSFALFYILLSLIRDKEKALKRENIKYKTLLESAIDGIYILNFDGKLIQFSDSFASMLGYTREEMANLSVFEWDTAMPREEIAKNLKLPVDTMASSETKHKRKDGSIIDVELTIKGVTLDGEAYLYCSSRDVTQIKIANEQLRVQKLEYESIFRASKDGIAILDLESNFLDFNDTYLDMTGFSRDELLSKSCVGLSIEEDRQKTVLAIKEAIDIGFVLNFEKSCELKNRTLTINMSLTLLPDKKRLLMISKDITEKRILEDTIKKTNEHLQEIIADEIQKRLEKEKLLLQQSKMAMMGEMIGAIAHQWRQPLNALGLHIQDMHLAYEFGELNKDYVDKFQRESMSIIKKMSKTIDDFRNFFKPIKERVDFSLENAVDETLSIIGPQLKNHSINVIFTKDKEHIVNGYQNEVEQALLIIMSNAQDALLEKNIKDPMINIAINDGSEGETILSIEDNAGGVPTEIIDRIFEPYFTTKEQGKGTGIGLYMAKEIVERQMNGRLSVKNINEGACFTIEIGGGGRRTKSTL